MKRVGKSHPGIGNPAPGFTLPLVSGGSFSLQDLHGKPALVSFLSHAA